MFGIRMAHAVALISAVITCLVVATAATPAQTTAISSKKYTVTVTVKDCTTATAAFVARCFQITTSPASAVVVNTGTDKKYTIPTTDRLRAKHTVWVPGLSPNTSYLAQVVVKNKAGKTVKTMGWSSFKTAAPGSAPVTVTSRGNKLLLNGRPWLPVGAEVLSSCPDTASSYAAWKVGYLDHNQWGCPSGTPTADDLHALLADRVWWREHPGTLLSSLSSLPELLGWNAGLHVQEDTHPYLLTCQPGFDSTSKLFLETRSDSRSSPIYYPLTVTKSLTARMESCLDEKGFKALFWTVTAAGGMIEYLAEEPWAPQNGIADVVPGLSFATEASRLDTMSTPLLAGKTVPLRFSAGSQVMGGAWSYGGQTYVIAVNTENTSVTSDISSQSFARAKTAGVMWENRSIKVRTGSISDTFAPLATHIYKIN